MDWLREVIWTIRQIEKKGHDNRQHREGQNDCQLEKLIKRNRTNKDTEIEIQLKPGHPRKK